MAPPFFYIPSYTPGQTGIVLDEDNSRHIVQVLRMKPGERLQLTDGKGSLLEAEILDDHKKKCLVQVKASSYHPPREKKVTLAISLLKNASRLEWVLEKATELGVTEIIPLLCERTENQHFRQDRMQAILVSALLQSQQVWLPVMPTPTPFAQVVENGKERYERRYIAHCLEEGKRVSLAATVCGGAGPGEAAKKSPAPEEGGTIILIGPEGDFSGKEIELALQHRYVPVTLGETRLRTETAGIVAATLLCVE